MKLNGDTLIIFTLYPLLESLVIQDYISNSEELSTVLLLYEESRLCFSEILK